MDWEQLDWEALDRLRAHFLSGRAAAGPYWHTVTDLECYHATFGERIGWKWDAVLSELRRRGWAPAPGGDVLDWGCGSGVAGQRVLAAFGPGAFRRLRVHDHSGLAEEFALHCARRAFPELDAARAGPAELAGEAPIGLLVVSHVLNELDDDARAALGRLAARAAAVLWVEPGTHAVSRALGRWRETLAAGGLHVVAPCTHRAPCGMLTPGNERHWCHFFAPCPAGIQAEAGWVRFAQRAGIDLRALPYSFLALDRRPAALPEGASRVIGEPRLYKGFARVFGCDAGGVAELTLQKRDAPEMFKLMKQGRTPPVCRWTLADGRITGPTPA
ncbi:MAG: hypothetical protein JNG83_01130 [Opitutaceae bacterium]|nr:hypothetical protein [Opitutaceae bacterium]